jgi:glutamine amidotransferase
MLAIVDYGMGNLRSVQKAFEKLGAAAVICDRPEQLRHAERLVLPGVGAFRDAIHALNERGFADPIREHVAADRPFLGICLGLQLLFDVSEEDGTWPGLGILRGRVVRFQNRPGLKIPHMGWNQLVRERPSRVLDGISADEFFYFVHSYFVLPEDDACIAARTEHGETFVSVIEQGNLAAVQFHPEKSQRAGQKLLRNFLEFELASAGEPAR